MLNLEGSWKYIWNELGVWLKHCRLQSLYNKSMSRRPIKQSMLALYLNQGRKKKEGKGTKKATTQQGSKQFYCYPMGNETENNSFYSICHERVDIQKLMLPKKICLIITIKKKKILCPIYEVLFKDIAFKSQTFGFQVAKIRKMLLLSWKLYQNVRLVYTFYTKYLTICFNDLLTMLRNDKSHCLLAHITEIAQSCTLKKNHAGYGLFHCYLRNMLCFIESQ